MARLTMREKRLLQYPPTPQTWVCRAKRTEEDGTKVACGTVNPGTNRRCWLCREAHKGKPRLLWPEYLVACEKAGIEPFTRWTPSTDPPPVKRTRRKKGQA